MPALVERTVQQPAGQQPDVTAITSDFDRIAAALVRWSGRPTLLAVTVMNVITGLSVGATIAAANFGVDSGTYRSCAVLLAEGQTDFCGSLYSPLMALAALPLTWVSPTTAWVAITLIGIVILVVGVALDTRDGAPVDRVLVVIAALTFPPVVYGLLLGQTTLLIAAALYPVARRPDAFRNGLPLGVALALAPKPLLVPILVWMIVWRRSALAVSLLTAVTLTGFGIAALGLDQYRGWLSVLTGAAQQSVVGTFVLSARDLGNLSLWPLNPATFVIACVVGAATLWAIVQDSSRGFVASIFAGLLLAPYSILYAFSILLLTVKPALAFAPRATRVLALTVNLVRTLPIAMIAWCVVGLGACVSFRRARRGRVA